MEKKASLKKRKSTKTPAAASLAEETKAGPPYRNIEESKKH
jgi:hypothetical protein